MEHLLDFKQPTLSALCFCALLIDNSMQSPFGEISLSGQCGAPWGDWIGTQTTLVDMTLDQVDIHCDKCTCMGMAGPRVYSGLPWQE